MSSRLHQHTPLLSAIDARGVPIVSVAYLRAWVDDEPEGHIQRLSHDPMGRTVQQWDARLWADGDEAGEPNQRTLHSLSGRTLCSASVDGGWRMGLFGAAGQALEGWDGRGTHRRNHFDEQLRPSSVHEQRAEGTEACVERYTYADATETATNRCGRLVRHDDTAGSQAYPGHGLSGGSLAETRQFPANLSSPDWPLSMAGRDALLEQDDEGELKGYTSRWAHDALGTAVTQVDAVGNLQGTQCDAAGQPRQIRLHPVAADVVVLLDDLVYGAWGQVVSATSGAGVVTTERYSEVEGRLQQRTTSRPGHVLQKLDYGYDPVGHVLTIEDAAQPTNWFAGARVDAVDVYRYDTLYRLVEAHGRESAAAAIHPALPDLGGPSGSADANRLRNYAQTYTYDAAGNLLTLTHASGGMPIYTRQMVVAARNNRSLFMEDVSAPPDIDSAFDAHGNLLRLEGTQGMTWDARDRLQRVTHVVRDDGADDDEVYVYDATGQRLRKVRVTQARAFAHVAEVRYLPGLEVHTNTATAEILHVATVHTGQAQVRHLHWLAARRDIPSLPFRYTLCDHIGSTTLELDQQGDVISHEGYYPHGGSAWWAARSAIEAPYKTIRYSGKERDATGLYYYGFRYYAPWLQRWIHPDPAGNIDGLNLYEFVASDPVNHVDASGHAREDALKNWKHLAIRSTRPAWVRTVTPGIVAVSISGNAAHFDSLGFTGLSPSPSPRTLHYLAINPAKYEGIVSGGDDLINPLSVRPGLFASSSGAHERTMAYINAAFYNVAHDADPSLPQHASIGPASSNIGSVEHARIPRDYASHYRKLTFAAGTFVHAAPALTTNSEIVFDPYPGNPLFVYAGSDVLMPGRLHHAAHPNARSGLSLPSRHGEGNVRMAVGTGIGRGPGSTGYTLAEWAQVMRRVDRLDNNGRQGIDIPHDSTNLDGGGSSMMSVIDGRGTRIYGIAQEPKGRYISTTITFRDRTAPPASASRRATPRGRCCSIA